MAKRKAYRAAKGAYKMTPRRRAALKKAQAASARKRRRRNVKRAAIGITAVAGIAGAAYAGHKYGGKAGSVASSVRRNVKSREFSVGGITVSRAAKNAHQPGAKEATRIAGAVSPAKAPRHNSPKVAKPKPTKGAQTPKVKRTTVPQIDKTQQSELMKEATKPLGPSTLDPSTFNPDGTITKNALAGITGKKLTAQQAHSAVAKAAKATGKPLTTKQRQSIVNQMIKDGDVVVSTRGRRIKPKTSSQKLRPRTEEEWNAALGFA